MNESVVWNLCRMFILSIKKFDILKSHVSSSKWVVRRWHTWRRWNPSFYWRHIFPSQTSYLSIWAPCLIGIYWLVIKDGGFIVEMKIVYYLARPQAQYKLLQNWTLWWWMKESQSIFYSINSISAIRNGRYRYFHNRVVRQDHRP